MGSNVTSVTRAIWGLWAMVVTKVGRALRCSSVIVVGM